MKKIVLIGSGNVATHFGALKEKGFNILQVWSYNTKNAKVLAEKLNCQYTSGIKNILAADLYIYQSKMMLLQYIRRFFRYSYNSYIWKYKY